MPTAWLALDHEDNCRLSFWRFIYLALRRVLRNDEYQNQKMSEFNPYLEVHHSDQVYFTKTLSLLMTENTADHLCNLPNNFILVIDDYQHIRDQAIHNSLKQLIKYMPGNMHLLIISRTEPHLSLNKFRAKGYIREFAIEHLRFQREEIDEYYRSMNFKLTTADLQKIEDKTEGWVVILYFIALTLREYGKHFDTLDVFNSTNRYLPEYFADEIMSSYSEEMRTFLVQTSILDWFSASLCDVVTGRQDSVRILQRLLKDHFLIFSLDQENLMYRYHPLFAGYLQNKLKKMPFGPETGLCRLAGEWCEKNGFQMDAIGYYIKAGEDERAVLLLTQELPGMLYRGEDERYLNWAAVLPEKVRQKHLSHCLAQAYIMLRYERLELAETWINFAGECLVAREKQDETEVLRLQGEITLLKGNLAIKQKNSQEAVRLIGQCLNNLPDILFFPNALMGLNQGEASLLSTHFGFYGHLREMEELYHSAYAEIRNISRQRTGYLPVAIAEGLYEQNRIDEAIPYLELGMEEAPQCNNLGALVPALITLGRIKKAQGYQEVAQEIISEISRKWDKTEDVSWLHLFEAFKVRLGLERSDLTGTDRWLENSQLSFSLCLETPREYDYITYARLLRARQRYDGALFLLARLAMSAEKKDRLPSMIEIYNLTALVYQEKGERVKALETLQKSLILGENHGYIRHYVDEGAGMLTLLNRFCRWDDKKIPAESRKKLTQYARKLQSLTKEYISKETIKVIDGNSLSLSVSIGAMQLTRREREVLQLIAKEMTNSEIAHVLGISCQTVKIHASNIYAKWGVKNRMQAIRRGRELRLLT
ncbi:putative ATP-dependent transcriptional regulator [Candidatus Desulfosporosinus infrequens]|uniref:Putative ATP-dependent transcriptional regulator n=1 Tax=Candidatus Desulfosporosinus infrequens TaxID=2043169 RepID=A0A2U3KLM7_9FIRM|nr:putative ATP-dependent transcriptional regulator [Candidatus Desulfosporosinus infrequens]